MIQIKRILLLSLFVKLFGVDWVVCYSQFKAFIPNGNNVPDPCSPDKIWNGIGHFNKQGGGSRNSFGLDFVAAGKQWTEALCRKDSDGDGKTNGQELGDPDCTWKVGQTPSRTTHLSHPGFCEPYNTPQCMQLNSGPSGTLQCDKQTFNCPSMNAPGVWSKEYRFMPQRVPAKKTTYICQAFESGYEANSTSIHKIALEPIIDNSNVLHHILLYGCPGSVRPRRPTAFTEPYECTMGDFDCYKIIAVWSLGSPGNCLSEKMGILMNGATGYNRFIIQLHWNNPTASDNLYDSSGVKIYFEQKRRPYDGGVFLVGQQYLELPPGKESIAQNAVCTKPCTQAIMTRDLKTERSIFFTAGFLHMHGAGIRGSVQLYHNETHQEYLIPNNTFRYDTPENIVYPSAIEYKSGDEIRIQCLYNTKANKHPVFYGEATSDEMCFGFLEYYPATTKYEFCLNYGIFTCEMSMGKYIEPTNYARANFSSAYDYGYVIKDLGHGTNCSVFQFLKNYHTKWQAILESSCSLQALDTCRADCRAIYDVMVKAEPCFSGWPFVFMVRPESQYGIIAPNKGYLFNSVINNIQSYVAPCRTEDRMRLNLLINVEPTSKAKVIESNQKMMPVAVFIGVIVALAVLVIVLLLVAFRFYIKSQQRSSKSKEKFAEKKEHNLYDNKRKVDCLNSD